MDWSLFQPHVKYPFLRAELLYTDHIPVSTLSLTPAVCTDYSLQLYYFAIVRLSTTSSVLCLISLNQISNILIRFIWVIYIPSSSASNMYLRFFIAGFLEMLRRWQWNFSEFFHSSACFLISILAFVVRLENEHLGNMDQYRVTREVPLPYSFNDNHHHIGDSDDD